MEFKINLNNDEISFLKQFAEKQKNGAKDNVGTMTPIHLVERIRKEYIESDDGHAWVWNDDCEWKTFDSFDEMLDYAREATKENYPPYDDVEYADVNDIWIESEKAYCEAYGIKAFPCKMVEYTEPVAFFFILDEAKAYMNGYQKHNCSDCRIYTYGLGYSNQGDLPTFRELLMKMGTALIADDEEKCEACVHEKVCNLWRSQECQNACSYENCFKSKHCTGLEAENEDNS